MQTVTRKAAVQLVAGDAARRHARRGHQRDDHGHGRVLDHRQGLRHHRERPLQRADRGPAGRPGVPRPAEADPRRPVQPGPDARAERRRQRPGQRLPVRRRQRDAAAVRHALGRARRRTTSRRSRSSRAARAPSTSTAPAASRSTRSASRARAQFHGQLSYQFQDNAHGRRPRRAAASRATSRTATWLIANLGGPILKDRLYFYGSYYRPTSTRENRANLYGELPDYDEHAQRGLRQADVHADRSRSCSTSATATRSATDNSDLFAANAAPDHRHRRRGAAEDRHRRGLVGDQPEELRDRSSSPHFANRHPGPAGQHRRRATLDGGRHASDTRQPRHAWALSSCRCR